MSNGRTFGEMRTDVQELINRTDFTDSLTDQFIREAINRAYRELRLPGYEAEATLTANANGAIELPATFLQIIDIEDAADNLYVFRKREQFPQSESAVPCGQVYYRRRLDKLLFMPAKAEGDEVTLIFYADPADLVSDDDKNPLMAFAPELIKYGACSRAADHFTDDRKPTYEAEYVAIAQQLKEQAEEQEMANLNMDIYANEHGDEY